MESLTEHFEERMEAFPRRSADAVRVRGGGDRRPEVVGRRADEADAPVSRTRVHPRRQHLADGASRGGALPACKSCHDQNVKTTRGADAHFGPPAMRTRAHRSKPPTRPASYAYTSK